MLQLLVERGAESWQFFAFLFAAVVTFVLMILGDLPWPASWQWRVTTKAVAFFAIAYLTLVNAGLRNWLAGELAEKVSVHKITISRLERGDRQPSMALLQRLTKALGVPGDGAAGVKGRGPRSHSHGSRWSYCG